MIGCPQPVAVNAIRNSVIEFLTKTLLLEQTVEVVLEPGAARCEIDAEAGTTVTRYLRGYRNVRGNPVAATTPSALDDRSPNWRDEVGEPVHAFIDSSSLIVHPVPVDAGVLYADFAYTLARSATRVADEILDGWAETIAAGALKRLLIMPGTSWLSPELAVYYGNQFAIGIDEARIIKIKGASSESMRVAPRAFQ